MDWHLNHGAEAAGGLVKAEQVGEIFRRPDLVGLGAGARQFADGAKEGTPFTIRCSWIETTYIMG